MSGLRRSAQRAGVLALLLPLAGFAPAAAAAHSPFTGPEVTLDRDEIQPGERVVLTIDGFAAANVTISVCGNEARRGSVDCNMFASEGLKLDTDGTPTIIQIPIAAPPVACPCVIRVSDKTNDEVAITPITLVGHPVEPLIDPPNLSDALDVTISAHPASPGLFERVRTSMGGPAMYEVTVTVKNRSTVPFSAVSLAGSVLRSSDQLATLELDDPGLLGPGRTWQQVVSAKVPGPSFGALQWRVDVSGAGAVITATETTDQRPMLLIVVVLFLVADVFLLIIRFMVRRRAKRADAAALDDEAIEAPGLSAGDDTVERELVEGPGFAHDAM